MLNSASFHSNHELCECANENRIRPDKIQQIVYGFGYYTLFYWEER